MTIRGRLVLSLTALACVLVLPAAFGYERLTVVRDIAYELRARHASAWVSLGQLDVGLRELDRRQRAHLAAPDAASRRAMWEALGGAAVPLAALREAGYRSEAAGTVKALKRLQAVTAELDRRTEAGRLGEATDYFFEQVLPAAQGVHASLEGVAEAIDRRSLGAATRARDVTDSASAWLLGGLVAALFLALILGSRLTGSLVRPIRRLQAAMSTVAGGDLEAPVELAYERPDEIGELTRSFRAMTQQLAELTRQRAEFVSILTHDLKTPINVIAGYAGMIQDDLHEDLDPDHVAALSAISEQAETLVRQVQHLLDLGRLEAGVFRLVEEDVYLVDLCTGLRRAFEGPAKKWMIGFEVALDPSAPEKIVGDMDRLRNEVLGNLLGNAFKFTEPGGRVSVRMTEDGGEVRIEVSDTGAGIPPHELPRIFDRYYQGRQGARSSGAGLGLAIAREVVEAHGGRIEATSRPRAGTTFRIWLPHRPPVRRAGGEGEASAGTAASGKAFVATAEGDAEPSTPGRNRLAGASANGNRTREA